MARPPIDYNIYADAPRNLWAAAAQKFRPLDAARVAVVGEELGTQRALPSVPADDPYNLALKDSMVANRDDLIAELRAELAQVKHQNEDLVQMCIARVGERDAAQAELKAAQMAAAILPDVMGERDTAEARAVGLEVELATLRADWAEHLRRGAQTVVVAAAPPPPAKPLIPARALRFSA
jgi:hypothetical protein